MSELARRRRGRRGGVARRAFWRHRHVASGWLVVMMVTLAGCDSPQPRPPDDSRPSGDVSWGYGADDGPARWGELSRDYDLCATGSRQSPIDLADATPAELPSLSFDYGASSIELRNMGVTIQADYDRGSRLVVGGQAYALVQFHFHTPSEHTIGGRAFPMEIHFVHRSAADRLAVVAVLAETGARHDALAAVLDDLPTDPELPRAVLDARIDARDVIPIGGATYRYEGSLTTPPCTESVQWIVMAEPIQVGPEQIDQFQAIVPRNSRPIQPRNGRRIETERS